MPDFQIKISTPVELEGAQKLAESLEHDIGKAKALGNATDELEAKLKTVKSAIDGADAAAKGGEGFKIFGHGAHEAHAAVDALSNAIPGLGELTAFMANRVTGSIGIAVLVYKAFSDAMADAMKTMNDLAQSDGAKSDWIEKQRDAADASSVSFAAWEHNVQRLAVAQQTLKDATDQLVQTQASQIQAQQTIAQAQAQAALAVTDLQEKLGSISHQQAVKIKLQIDEESFRQELEVKIKEMQAELQSRLKEYQQNEDQEPGKRTTVDATKAKADAAERARIENASKLEQNRKDLEFSQDRMKKAQEIIEQLQGKGAWAGEYDPSDPQYYALKAARDTVNTESNVQGQLRGLIGNEQHKSPALDTAAETTKADYEASKKDYEEAAALSKDLERQLAKLKGDIAAEQAKNTVLEGLHNQTAETRSAASNITPADIARAAAQRQYAQTPGVDVAGLLANAHNSVINARSAVIAGHGNDAALITLLNELIGLSQDIHANSATRADAADLRRQVEELRSQVHNNRRL